MSKLTYFTTGVRLRQWSCDQVASQLGGEFAKNHHTISIFFSIQGNGSLIIKWRALSKFGLEMPQMLRPELYLPTTPLRTSYVNWRIWEHLFKTTFAKSQYLNWGMFFKCVSDRIIIKHKQNAPQIVHRILSCIPQFKFQPLFVRFTPRVTCSAPTSVFLSNFF